MSTNNIYYACVAEIVGKKFILGKNYWDSGYRYTLKTIKNRYVYKSSECYIDLISKNKYKLYSQLFDPELEVGMLVIDDKFHNLVNIKNLVDTYNLQHEDSQIEIKKHMTKRKILRMISGGKK